MNEQLIGDLFAVAVGRMTGSTSKEFSQKFAEEIVKECIQIVAKRKDQAIDDGWNVDEAMSMAEMDLLEHFGVEE
jgi:hypothetical protein